MRIERKRDSRSRTQDSRREEETSSSGSSSCLETVSSLSIPAFQRTPSVTAAFSVRLGGVSQPPYSALNLAYHVGDADASVAENRRRFCDSLGIEVGSLVIAQQVHGDRIAVIDESQAGCGAYRHADAIPGADGMVTASRSVALAVLTADCVPVLIVDPVREAVGIAHAGWRGTLQRIASRAVLKMRDAFGTEPVDCLVALGPSIGSCCYTVGEDVASLFRREFGSVTCVMENRLDLRRAIEIQLVEIGVERRNISSAGLCAACNLVLFYSHRAEGGCAGRMMSVIKLND